GGVALTQRRLHHVDANHHPGATAVRGVVDLAGPQGRGIAEVDELEAVAELLRVAHVPLVAEPPEPFGEQREDVDLHGSRPRKARSTSMSRASMSTRLTASLTNGTSTPSGPTSSRSHEGASITRWTSPRPSILQPTRSAASHSSSARDPPS